MDNSNVKVVNIEEKLALFTETWNPKIVGELNDDKVQLVKINGEFVWHHHDIEDEFFMVLSGELIVYFENREVVVKEGEFIIIPHMVEHKTAAKVETSLLYIEPKGALNTGNVKEERSRVKQDSI
jgi:mannose-6-phosphate isomerase-like protein (cupin superfamily)